MKPVAPIRETYKSHFNVRVVTNVTGDIKGIFQLSVAVRAIWRVFNVLFCPQDYLLLTLWTLVTVCMEPLFFLLPPLLSAASVCYESLINQQE